MSIVKTLAASFVPIAIGGAIAAGFVLSKKPPPKAPPPPPAAVPVEVVAAKRALGAAGIVGHGAVIPARSVALSAEVTGKIVWLSPRLVPGTEVAAGEVLVKLDRREYELAVEREKANVERARFELKVEEGRAAVAEREWALLETKDSASPEGREMALRRPHLANAKAALAAAESGLLRAELSLERTAIKAPFAGLVIDESVELGLVVAPQSRLLTMVGSDELWVQVSIPVDQLGLVSLPVGERPGAKARITQDLGEARVVRSGQVIRLLGDLDPVGRMARLLVRIDDPLGKKAGEDALPMLVNAYVSVELEGKAVGDAVELPLAALRQGDEVWVVDGESRVDLRPVEVSFRGDDRVLVRRGLAEGERVVVSRMTAPAKGQLVRVSEREPPIQTAGEPKNDPAKGATQ